MAASVVSPEAPDVVASLVEVADEVSEDDGDVIVVPVPPISSCSDRSTDCMSLLSDEKPPPDDTVPDVELVPVELVPVELLLWLFEEGGAKADVADVPLVLDEPKSAARLLVLLVRAERDDICCASRENSLCSIRRGILRNQARNPWKNEVNGAGCYINEAGRYSGCASMSFSSQSRKARIFGWLRRCSG